MLIGDFAGVVYTFGMTVYTSNMISGMIGQQLGMFSGYSGYAQQAMPGGYGMQAMAPQLSLGNLNSRNTGMYGEQMAMRMANFGQSAMNVGGAAGFGIAGLMGAPVDPMSGMLGGAMAGMAFGPAGAIAGAGLGLGAGAMVSGVRAVTSAYTGAFFGGMQDQGALNSTIRNNFSFMGGQGGGGRGFSQGQMGQIGSMISSELRRNPFTNSQELNGLIAGGAEAGMFTGVRDVQQFSQNFRRMLDTLRSVQRELGGTLTEALGFVRSSQQAGIFQNADRINFASEIRSAEAVTGMDRNQLIALSAQGANIARTYGARGQQGAFGVLRAAQTMGSALSSGAVSSELLSEATGGLTGADAVAAFAQRTMQRAGAFSRRPMGRYSLFAMSNADGTGLDDDMLQRFRSGDLTEAEVRGAAHRNVGSMGRARALNREGRLRGEMMEEGGLSAQIGMMRLMVGDRVMDSGDDLGQLVLQRRFGMSQPESEMMMRMMRNQGRIAENEASARVQSGQDLARDRDRRENRSLDAFTRELEHGLSDATGLTSARDMGRRTMTRISSFVERAINDIMGVTESSLSSGDRSALNRVAMGRATQADLERLGGATGGSPISAADVWRRSTGGSVLSAIGLHGREGMTQSIGARLQAYGIEGLKGDDAGVRAMEGLERVQMARAGLVGGSTRDAVRTMERDRSTTMRAIADAERIAERGSVGYYAALQRRGISGEAADAFLARAGVTDFGEEINGSNLGGGGRTNAGMWTRDASRALGVFQRMQFAGSLPSALIEGAGLVGALGGRPGFETMNALASAEERSAFSMQDHIRQSADRMVRESKSLPEAERREVLATAARMRSVNSEQLAALAGSEAFQRQARAIAGASGDELQAQIASLEESAMLADTPEQRNAQLQLAQSLREDAQRNGGSLSEERRAAMSGAGMSDERRRAQILERNRIGVRRAGIATRLEERASGLSGADRASVEEVRDLARRLAEAGVSGTPEEEQNAAQAYRQHIASLDPDSAAYRAWSESLPPGAEGSQERASVSQTRQFVRDMSGPDGRGRVTSRGNNAALGGITGGLASDLTFQIRGPGGQQRNIRGSNANEIMRLLRGGGRHAESIRNQLTEHLQGLGVEGAADLTQSFASMAQGGFTADEARQLEGQLDRSGVNERAAERQMQSVRRADPLGAERNDILRSILSAVQANSNTEPGETTTNGAAGGTEHA